MLLNLRKKSKKSIKKCRNFIRKPKIIVKKPTDLSIKNENNNIKNSFLIKIPNLLKKVSMQNPINLRPEIKLRARKLKENIIIARILLSKININL